MICFLEAFISLQVLVPDAYRMGRPLGGDNKLARLTPLFFVVLSWLSSFLMLSPCTSMFFLHPLHSFSESYSLDVEGLGATRVTLSAMRSAGLATLPAKAHG